MATQSHRNLFQNWYKSVRDTHTIYYFIIPTVLLIILVSFVITRNRFIGAALLGATPPIVYALYLEGIHRPSIEIKGDLKYRLRYIYSYAPYSDNTNTTHPSQSIDSNADVQIDTSRNLEQQISGYAKNIYRKISEEPASDREGTTLLNQRLIYIYPYIDVVLEVENTGRKTAENCSIRISERSTGQNDSMPTYFARWESEIGTTVTMDLDPNAYSQIAIMRFLPENSDELRNGIKEEYQKTPYDYKLPPDHEFNFQILSNWYRKGEGVEASNGFKFYFQRPVSYITERALAAQSNSNEGTREALYSFYGQYIEETKDEYKIELECSAVDWRNYAGEIEIRLEDGIENPEMIDYQWETATVEPLKKALIKTGLIKKR